jgi:hypothetical protein
MCAKQTSSDMAAAIGGVIYEVRGEPLRDALRHVWKAEAREP